MEFVVTAWIVMAIAVIAVVSIAFVFAFSANKRRRKAMARQGARMGFAHGQGDPRLKARFESLGDPFDRGFGRQLQNILTGTWNGRPAVSFDYSYMTRSGGENSHTQTHYLSVVCLHSGLSAPSLSVLPEGPLARAMGKLVGDDIQLESEDFNRAFRVTSENRRFAIDVLHPRTMQFLLAHGRRGFRFLDGQAIHVIRGRLDPLAVPGVMGYLAAILDQIPDHVRRSLGGH